MFSQACVYSDYWNVEKDCEIDDFLFVSKVTRKIYVVPSKQIWRKLKDNNDTFNYSNLVIGVFGNGAFAIWLQKQDKSIIVSYEMASGKSFSTIEENADRIRCNNCDYKDIINRQNSMFQQFSYKYNVICIDNENFGLEQVREALADGTYNKCNDGGLLKYRRAGKPKKLALEWHIKKSEYSAFFWFDDGEIRRVFDHFYGVHPDTKADFMIRINPNKNKYELALYRYGLKEPQVIGEDAYQMIVFRNKFECYRSKNYDQPRGAWIW